MNERIQEYNDKMQKTIDHLASEYQTIRAGRANPHVLDRIRIDYYGTPTPIQQVGNITIPEPRMIQIQPWEKNLLKDIEKAIQMSDIGINPTNDGQVIRLVFPELTEERRKDLVKDVKKKGEADKVAIRNIRRDGNDAFKKMGKTEDVSEDEIKQLEDELQKITDKYIKTKLGECMLLLVSEADGKVNMISMATDGAVKKGCHSGNLIKSIASIVGGGGGGKPSMAQAGGKNPQGIDKALEEALNVIKTQIG